MRNFVVPILAVVFLLPTSAPVDAQTPLRIDFNADNRDMQMGWVSIMDGSSWPVAEAIATDLSASGSVSLDIRPLVGAERVWISRGSIEVGFYVTQSNLLRDFLFIYAYGADGLVVTVDGLRSGPYTFTSYHHDPTYSDHGAIDVYIADAGEEQLVAEGLVQSTGHSPSEIAVAETPFKIVGDGPVTIRIMSVPNSGNGIAINGFEIAPRTQISSEAKSWSSIKSLYQ